MLDLIETLTAARMDWLAFELVEGIQLGRTLAETPDALAETRRRVREDDQPKVTAEPPKLAVQDQQPIRGDDQIDWAAKYVAERLDTALDYLARSIERLDAIASGEAAGLTATPDSNGVLVVLTDDRAAIEEVQRKVNRAEVEAAIAILPQLRHALDIWSAQMRGQPLTK